MRQWWERRRPRRRFRGRGVRPGAARHAHGLLGHPLPALRIRGHRRPGGYSGFDIDLLTAVADALDLGISIQVVDFDGLQSGATLATGQCDIAASAMTITEERRANLDFSDPYYDSLQSLLVRADSGISSIKDLSGKNLGVQQGTTGEAYASENAPADAEIIGYPSDADLEPAIRAGNIDAILRDRPVNVEHERSDSTYTIVEDYNTDEQYGFAFAKGEKRALLAAVNDALIQLRSDGTYQQIYDGYFSAN
ncbi:transporter substrate-binding domain-containing protein [Microbacterium sp. NIBRBAC000506063]|uniref:transporter substrate-binding domain-containing protein n=1 Tax=Microbacterium sp. NIBRBAC000506063 TaxID=2734618 RepID=UPI001CB6BBB3|nr:transporter substrate-binding domain-containing protein [Microbacterium sp. NIBRBAC000506063]